MMLPIVLFVANLYFTFLYLQKLQNPDMRIIIAIAFFLHTLMIIIINYLILILEAIKKQREGETK